MVCLELHPLANACGHERVSIITQMLSSLNPKQHTILIFRASTLGNNATNIGLQHTTTVDNLAIVAVWPSQRTHNTTKLAHFFELTHLVHHTTHERERGAGWK